MRDRDTVVEHIIPPIFLPAIHDRASVGAKPLPLHRHVHASPLTQILH
jgi:hypothetical protein